ncbi:flagellar biosynthesis protein FlhF [Aneurinibacillus terranovensis]|uniref:flagellar biosynthesis protein FlhF n=1 Tax=Aneurinibacillus terranovensis TaxID=278991 RepID=UPI000403EF60|nr:flagellar biosynthesis protein FlhF [Aneurinibacillus terranovensis]
MRVKRYVVDSMSDALQKIRVDLGKDAVILNTKPVKTGGFLGLFAKKQIEVIAAIDQNEKKEPAKTRVLVTAKPPKSRAELDAPIFPPVLTKEQEKTEKESVMSAGAAGAAAVYPQRPFPAEKKQAETQENKAGDLSKELQDMRNVFWKLMMSDAKDSRLPPVLTAITKQLADQEVEEKIIASIVEHVFDKLAPHELQDERKVRDCVKEQLHSLLTKKPGHLQPLKPSTRFVHIIGPTGVGKTTTLAKLAAENVLEQGRKVGMMTSDTYRIAAVEQLKTYANILNLPLKVIYSPEELAVSVERLSDCDLIFLDTAGRNYRNKEYVEEINKLLYTELPSETFLVVSLTAKYRDIEAIVQSFSGIRIDKVIFTKVDETSTYGSILNLVATYDLALSYLTTGQNVPDDIEAAAPEKVVSLLLGDDAHE